MIIELLCRYFKDPDDEVLESINDELRTQELIQGESFNKSKEYNKLLKEHKCYEYGPFMLNLLDVKFANHVDKDHVALRFDDGNMFIFKIGYEEFKTVYQTLTAVVITSFTIDEASDKITLNGK